MRLVKLAAADGSWAAFEADWKGQCEGFGEDLEDWAVAILPPLRDLIGNPHRRAGVYALRDGSDHHAVCQANSAMLPSTTGYTLRVRFLTLSPAYDFGSKGVSEYAAVLGKMFSEVIALSVFDEMRSEHVKFHAPSPADLTLFSAISDVLKQNPVFEDVAVRGSWLYITMR